MSDHQINTETTPIDELWLHDWAAEGIAALESYLAKQAAFAAFLAALSDLDSYDGHSTAAG